MYYRRTIQVCYFVWYDGFQALINSLYWLYNDVFLRNNIDNKNKNKKGKRKNGFAPNSLTKILSSFARASQFPLIVTTTKTAHVCASVFVFSLFSWNDAGLSWRPNFKRWNVGKLTMMRAATLSRRDRRRKCDRPTWRKSRQREKPLVWGEKANSPLLLTRVAFYSANCVAICLRWENKQPSSFNSCCFLLH